MSSGPKLSRQMTMITHSIFTEFLVTDVTKSAVIINQFIMHCHYHTFLELKLFINCLDILLKHVYKYLCNIVIVKLFYKSNRFLRIECVVKTLMWGFKISIYYKWDPHWPIVIFKYIFVPPLGSSILMAWCDIQYSWWDANDLSEEKVIRHLKHTCLTWPSFDVCKDNSLLIYLMHQ